MGIKTRTPLEVRHEAALELLQPGDLGPEEALLAVVWPGSERLADENVPSGRQVYSEEVREELRRRHEQGETITELAAKTSIPYPTVKLVPLERRS